MLAGEVKNLVLDAFVCDTIGHPRGDVSDAGTEGITNVGVGR